MGKDRSEAAMVPNRTETMAAGRGLAGATADAPQRVVGQSAWRNALDLVATLAMLFVAAGIVWNWYRPFNPRSTRPAVPVPTKPVSLDGVPLLGDPGAKAGVLIFSDFQCPYCERFANETMPVLKERYVDRGLVRVGFLHLPLPIHNRAARAAQSAECAAKQGQFWTMHDALFRNPSRLEDDDLTSDAVAIGLDRNAFLACMSSAPSDRVKQNIESAEGFGLRATPSFIVGRLEGGALHATSVLVGVQSFDVFEKVLGGSLAAR
jgi:protein-disulfide isomerase